MFIDPLVGYLLAVLRRQYGMGEADARRKVCPISDGDWPSESFPAASDNHKTTIWEPSSCRLWRRSPVVSCLLGEETQTLEEAEHQLKDGRQDKGQIPHWAPTSRQYADAK